MDYQAVVTLIGSLGFPIVACIAMGFYVVKESNNHREEVDAITKALNNNTLALQSLTDRIVDRLGG